MLIISLLGITFLFAFFSLVIGTKASKYVSLLGSIVVLAINVIGLVYFDEDYFNNYSAVWLPSLGINFLLKMDGISKVLVLLTNLLSPLIILSSFGGRDYSDKSNFYALILFMQVALIGVFTAYDCFLFYVFWEAALIPVYFICAIWGGEDKIRVTFKFFIYTIFGSLFMLMAIIYLYLQTPYPHNFSWEAFSILQLDASQELFVFLAFFLAFAIKMPLFPLHTWQPDTYTSAPTPGTMLLSGIMLKMGFFGIIRWLIPITPFAVSDWSFLIILLSTIGIIYASLIAIKQKDFKRLIAFSSIAHVGLISAGLFSGNIEGVQGAVIQMFNHGINVVGLFFVLEIISQRTGTRNVNELGGIVHSAPILSICFVIIMLGSVALPLTNGFPGEFLLLLGLYKYNVVLASFAGVTVILGAVYMLRMYKNIMLGEANAITKDFKDVSTSEFLVLAPICIIILTLGVFPNFVLNISEPMAKELLNYLSTNVTELSAIIK